MHCSEGCCKIGSTFIVRPLETEDGILISPREVLAMDALDRIGKTLQKQGITLEELIATGREV
jgi:hypothetical protein